MNNSHFVVKLHPEINIKSKDVRKRFVRLLQANIRLILGQRGIEATVQQKWDKIDVVLAPEEAGKAGLCQELLCKIPGVDQVLQVETSVFDDVEGIVAKVQQAYQAAITHKTFAVRVKRKGKHTFSSLELAKHVGSELFLRCDTAGVDLSNPQVTVAFEIDGEQLILVKARHRGLGGMPLPTQEDVLSLVSGGFDSSVSSYHLIRRGAKTHYCFFNLGGNEHEIGVRQMCHYLWQTYSPSHSVKFIAVDFAAIVADILENVEPGVMGVVLKRMMLRAATIVANNLGINGLVTGECLGQVSSQTLSNLHLIEAATDKLVLRPLICSDKQDIVDTAREIGTEDIAKSIPEYCGVISLKPNVKAPLQQVLDSEAKCNLALLEQAVRASDVQDIRKLGVAAEREIKAVDSVSNLPQDAVVLDIRSPVEADAKPLALPGIECQTIPFYKLQETFSTLPQGGEYYLYCDRGVMSKMQALLLHEHGHANVKVYRP